MTLDVLISCMNQNDTSILKRTNVQSGAIVINQCDKNDSLFITYKDVKGQSHKIKFFSTVQRGLSKSRNEAIKQSQSDLCLICDDDEILVDEYEKLIVDAFSNNPDIDVIAFKLKYHKKIYPKSSKKINRFSLLKINSPQIAFRRDKVLKNNIFFDEFMGSGTGNGGGEENKFLMDCYRSNLKIIYLPILIAEIEESSESNWNSTFDKQYFMNRGWTTNRILGTFQALVYAFFFSLTKYKIYGSKMGFFASIKYQLYGIFESRS
ncbi:glycosyltransferase involved in cell wall biosynthesis [Pseudoalteromonas sp. MBR-15]|jgi:glycosyltransferase involved in cell wall biosynthesis